MKKEIRNTGKKGNVYIIVGLVIVSAFMVVFFLIFFSQQGFFPQIVDQLEEKGILVDTGVKDRNKDEVSAFNKKDEVLRTHVASIKDELMYVITFTGIVETEEGDKPFKIVKELPYKDFAQKKVYMRRVNLNRYEVEDILREEDIEEIKSLDQMNLEVKQQSKQLDYDVVSEPKKGEFIEGSISFEGKEETVVRIEFRVLEEKAIQFRVLNYYADEQDEEVDELETMFDEK